MHRDDKSKYLLFIEPELKDKSAEPIDDEWTELMQKALNQSTPGGSGYSEVNCSGAFHVGNEFWFRGSHTNCDGVRSDCKDFLLQNGLITNSLCVHYLRYFRNNIGNNDWDKLRDLKEYYIQNNKLNS